MRTICVTVALALMLAAGTARAQVSVREEMVTIPTWQIGPPAVHSAFHTPRNPIYPYTLNDLLTDNKVDKAYHGDILENEYIKVLVLPEIGGRIHGAIDKTNGYEWLYWQKTIKPGLISLTGAWISGGIEWNFPRGHRPSGFMTVDHRVIRHGDGSATVWVGETEPVYRMRWLVGITIFPGRSYLQCDYIFINPTSHMQSFQYWSTSATHANEFTQAQYPGDTITGHGKHEFWHWPVDHGVDLTWWKNSPNASSYFAVDNPSDWFGTYDHQARGGMVHVADHRVMPGKKLWTWGSGPSGRIWEDILSDGGGAYFEPQAGAWSDNQPDFHWIWPNEVKTARDYWYPVRDTRGYHNANTDFAVNTDLKDGVAFGAVYATGVSPQTRVVLENTRTHAILQENTVAIAPDRPFAMEARVEADVTIYDLRLSVYNASGSLLIEVQQQRPEVHDLPAPLVEPGDPASMTADGLVQAGAWLDKFLRREEGVAYYVEALKRDPDDTRANLDLGMLKLKQGEWNTAIDHLDRVLKHDDDNSRAHFGRGLAALGLDHIDRAYKELSRATYTNDFAGVAYFNLAGIAMRRGDYVDALAKLSEAESRNTKFADIFALRAAVLRQLGRLADARAAAEQALALDPMHFMAGYEKGLSLRADGTDGADWEPVWRGFMRGDVQNYLELACAYLGAGFYTEADAMLAMASTGDAARVPSMVNYLRGYVATRRKSPDATEFFKRASAGPVAYTNPNRSEERAALEAALAANPDDAHAHLFLGNLLYANGLAQAGLDHWKTAVRLDDGLSLAWRNVGYGELDLNKDPKAAYAAYQKTLGLDPNDARALLELDQVAERLRVPSAERLAFLDQHSPAVEQRDDLVARRVDLQLESGGRAKLQAAHDALKSRHFHNWEGSYLIHEAWVEVNQRLGDSALEAKEFTAAAGYFGASREYPKNLEVAPRTPDFRAHLNWDLARLNRAMRRQEQERKALREILAEKYTKPHLGTIYQARAQKALGNDAASRSLLDDVERTAREHISGKFEYRGSPEIVGHYLLSLVLEERGDQAGASQERQAALALDPRAHRLALLEAQIDTASAHQ